VLATLLHGAAYCTMGSERGWIDAGQPGVVLSILTLSALQGAAFTVPYAMAKAGVLAMTKSLAVEWGRHGIRLVAIAPGTFRTAAAAARLRPGGLDHADVPLNRAGRHEELTDLAAYLVSENAGYITCECVLIDGGRRYLGGARAGVMEAETRAASTRTVADENVRAMVLTATGKGFCVGADGSAIATRGTERPTYAGVTPPPGDAPPTEDFARHYSYMLNIGKPVIAGINSALAGVGLCLTLFCDIRFMAVGG